MEAVDPIVLSMHLANVCEPCGNPCGDPCNDQCTDQSIYDVPAQIYEDFGSDITFGNVGRRVYVTLGQFSIISLVRDTQLLMPSYDYYVPDKECPGSGGTDEDDACTLFSRIHFPVDEFFPPDILSAPDGYREARTTFCG